MTTKWLSQTGLALTRLGNALLGGRAEESMSSRAWRADGNRKLWGRLMRPLIDYLASWFKDANHCQNSYYNDRNKEPLPVIGDV